MVRISEQWAGKNDGESIYLSTYVFFFFFTLKHLKSSCKPDLWWRKLVRMTGVHSMLLSWFLQSWFTDNCHLYSQELLNSLKGSWVIRKCSRIRKSRSFYYTRQHFHQFQSLMAVTIIKYVSESPRAWLTNTGFWAPPVVCGLMGLNRGLRICIYKFPDDAEAAGLGSTLGELLH